MDQRDRRVGEAVVRALRARVRLPPVRAVLVRR
jgi:hypothetical protein